MNLSFSHYASRVGDFMQNLAFLISLVVICKTASFEFRTLSDLFRYRSEYWRRYTLRCVSWGVEGEMEFNLEGASEYPGKEIYLVGLGDRRKRCFFIVFIFMRLKEAKRCPVRCFKFIIWGCN